MDNQPVNLSSKQATNHETWFTQIDRHPFSCVQPFQAWTSPDQRIRQPGAVPTVALVFGAENRGLTNVELSHAQRFLCPQGWPRCPLPEAPCPLRRTGWREPAFAPGVSTLPAPTFGIFYMTPWQTHIGQPPVLLAEVSLGGGYTPQMILPSAKSMDRGLSAPPAKLSGQYPTP